MKKWLFIVLGLIFSPYLLYANTVRLINNSPYDLRAAIRGGDGSFLGELIVKSQRETVWTDTYGNYGTYGGANAGANQASRSKTPYSVLWYCMSGSTYAVCDVVATGSVVTSQSCLGPRMCQPSQQEKYPSEPEGNYLQEYPTTPPLDQ